MMSEFWNGDSISSILHISAPLALRQVLLMVHCSINLLPVKMLGHGLRYVLNASHVSHSRKHAGLNLCVYMCIISLLILLCYRRRRQQQQIILEFEVPKFICAMWVHHVTCQMYNCATCASGWTPKIASTANAAQA